MSNNPHEPDLIARLLAENATLNEQLHQRTAQIGKLAAELDQEKAQRQELDERNTRLANDRDDWKARAIAWTPSAA